VSVLQQHDVPTGLDGVALAEALSLAVDVFSVR
jgi:hypothetical protein